MLSAEAGDALPPVHLTTLSVEGETDPAENVTLTSDSAPAVSRPSVTRTYGRKKEAEPSTLESLPDMAEETVKETTPAETGSVFRLMGLEDRAEDDVGNGNGFATLLVDEEEGWEGGSDTSDREQADTESPQQEEEETEAEEARPFVPVRRGRIAALRGKNEGPKKVDDKAESVKKDKPDDGGSSGPLFETEGANTIHAAPKMKGQAGENMPQNKRRIKGAKRARSVTPDLSAPDSTGRAQPSASNDPIDGPPSSVPASPKPQENAVSHLFANDSGDDDADIMDPMGHSKKYAKETPDGSASDEPNLDAEIGYDSDGNAVVTEEYAASQRAKKRKEKLDTAREKEYEKSRLETERLLRSTAAAAGIRKPENPRKLTLDKFLSAKRLNPGHIPLKQEESAPASVKEEPPSSPRAQSPSQILPKKMSSKFRWQNLKNNFDTESVDEVELIIEDAPPQPRQLTPREQMRQELLQNAAKMEKRKRLEEEEALKRYEEAKKRQKESRRQKDDGEAEEVEDAGLSNDVVKSKNEGKTATQRSIQKSNQENDPKANNSKKGAELPFFSSVHDPDAMDPMDLARDDGDDDDDSIDEKTEDESGSDNEYDRAGSGVGKRKRDSEQDELGKRPRIGGESLDSLQELIADTMEDEEDFTPLARQPSFHLNYSYSLDDSQPSNVIDIPDSQGTLSQSPVNETMSPLPFERSQVTEDVMRESPISAVDSTCSPKSTQAPIVTTELRHFLKPKSKPPPPPKKGTLQYCFGKAGAKGKGIASTPAERKGGNGDDILPLLSGTFPTQTPAENEAGHDEGASQDCVGEKETPAGGMLGAVEGDEDGILGLLSGAFPTTPAETKVTPSPVRSATGTHRVAIKKGRRIIIEEEDEEDDEDIATPPETKTTEVADPPGAHSDLDLDSGPEDYTPAIAMLQQPPRERNIYVDEEAEEEEDEFFGRGGEDGEEEGLDEDDKDLVVSDEDVDVSDVINLHIAQEQQADKERVDELMKDVTSGNLRKKKSHRDGAGKGFDMMDGDDVNQVILESIRARHFRSRSGDDEDDEDMSPLEKYASKPETAAFAKCFSFVEDKAGFLPSSDEDDIAPLDISVGRSKRRLGFDPPLARRAMSAVDSSFESRDLTRTASLTEELDDVLNEKVGSFLEEETEMMEVDRLNIDVLSALNRKSGSAVRSGRGGVSGGMKQSWSTRIFRKRSFMEKGGSGSTTGGCSTINTGAVSGFGNSTGGSGGDGRRINRRGMAFKIGGAAAAAAATRETRALSPPPKTRSSPAGASKKGSKSQVKGKAKAKDPVPAGGKLLGLMSRDASFRK
ncbi:hypothetical protein HK104_006691 [Borealophlyctis nickersoniae]|nr:hypothetical protein HK104_006691 [Borealophlyctis nickersoniae]